MGDEKYAPYILSAYAVTALAFVWMVVDTLVRARNWRRRAEKLEREQRE